MSFARSVDVHGITSAPSLSPAIIATCHAGTRGSITSTGSPRRSPSAASAFMARFEAWCRSQNVSRVGAPRLVLPVERDAAAVRRPGVDQGAEVELVGDAPLERRDQILVAPAGDDHARTQRPWRADAWMYLRDTGERSSGATHASITTNDLLRAASSSAARSSPAVSTRKPRPPQARASSAYGHGGTIEQLGAPHHRPEDLPAAVVHHDHDRVDSPWRGACAISGPVIWKAPSPHRTSGRTPRADLRAERAGHAEAHRRVEALRQVAAAAPDAARRGRRRACRRTPRRPRGRGVLAEKRGSPRAAAPSPRAARPGRGVSRGRLS